MVSKYKRNLHRRNYHYQLIVILKKLTGKSDEEILNVLSSFFRDAEINLDHLETSDLEKVREIVEKFKLDFEDAIHFFYRKRLVS